jgi:hypothetical protein
MLLFNCSYLSALYRLLEQSAMSVLIAAVMLSITNAMFLIIDNRASKNFFIMLFLFVNTKIQQKNETTKYFDGFFIK